MSIKVDINCFSLPVAIIDSRGFVRFSNSAFDSYTDLNSQSDAHLKNFLGEKAQIVLDSLNNFESNQNSKRIVLDDQYIVSISIYDTNESLYFINFEYCKEIASIKTKNGIFDSDLSLATLYNTIPYPLFVKDSEGYYVNYNDRFKELIVGENESPLKRFKTDDLYNTYNEEDRQVINGYDRLMFEKSLPKQVFERKIKCTDGIIRDFLILKSLIKSNIFGKVYIFGLMLDISQIKKIADKLEESRNEYFELFTTSMDSIYIIGNDYKIIDANPAFFQLLGLPREDITGRNILDFLEYDADAEILNFEDRRQLVFVSFSGARYTVEQNIYPKKDKRGNIIGYQAVARDITNAKRIETMLFESRLRYDLAVRGSNDGLWDWDIKEDRVWLSERYLEMIGWEMSDMKNINSFLDKLHPDDREKTEKNLENHFKKQSPYNIEYRFLTKNYGYRWFLARGIAALDSDGQPFRVAGSVQDIHARKTAEELNEKYVEELKRSNRELQQFAYVASHDLQEPLRMVSSFVQLLSKRYADRFDDEGKEYLEFAIDGAVRMQNLIQDLLAYSRIESNNNEFKMANINKIFEKVMKSLELRLQESGASIVFPDVPHSISCDEIQIYQLFLNLISNSLKFHSKERKPMVVVSFTSDESYFYFKVSDNGIGFDMKFKDRIFQIFQRLNTREEYSGTGIGLAICKRITERHGGNINAESQIGIGTQITFSIAKRKKEN